MSETQKWRYFPGLGIARVANDKTEVFSAEQANNLERRLTDTEQRLARMTDACEEVTGLLSSTSAKLADAHKSYQVTIAGLHGERDRLQAKLAEAEREREAHRQYWLAEVASIKQHSDSYARDLTAAQERERVLREALTAAIAARWTPENDVAWQAALDATREQSNG